LGVGKAAKIDGDPRKVIVHALALEVQGRTDVSIDLSTPDALSRLKDQVMVIKEGVEYRLKVVFKIQHEVVSGLKYLHVVKRSGIKVDKMEEMVGSYGPSPDLYTKKFALEEAPSGMLARGSYKVKSRFIDDDGQCHLEWDWVSLVDYSNSIFVKIGNKSFGILADCRLS
jgi:Rho GDP-dissociation inhibitor